MLEIKGREKHYPPAFAEINVSTRFQVNGLKTNTVSLLYYYSHSERYDAEREIKNRLNPSEDIKWGQLSLSPLSALTVNQQSRG